MQTDESKKSTPRPLTSTMEDYLEAIVNLENEKKAVRVKDIAKRLGVRMPTVTSMLKTLRKAGLVNYEKYEYIQLTNRGKKVGKEIDRRHHALKKFLRDILGIDPDTADEEACKMEHAVSASTLNRFVEFMGFIESCPRAGKQWLEYFQEYRQHGRNKATCLEYMRSFEQLFKKQLEAAEMETEIENGA
ncbi:MAG: metal-dependent transcriptional regulator [Deltaproteobacteria bacterium]|nr:MAG: metal-dependent transcriptional regulator [Deltaproteobacteria bacterium]